MKIVLLGTVYPYRGGLATFNERLAIELYNQGHQVVIYNFSLQYPSFLFPGKSQMTDEKREFPDYIPNYRKVNSINPFNWIKIGLELKSLAPDLILFRYWLPFMAPNYSVIAWLAKLNKKTKIFTIIDNAISHEPKFYDIPVTKLFFKLSDYFVAMAQKVKEDFHRLSDKKCDLQFHPMYDTYGSTMSKTDARLKLNLNSDDKIILFFGFIREYKGLDWLIEAMSDFDIKSQNIKLIIAGEFYVDSQPYFDIVSKFGLKNNIIWKNDFIADTEISTYFCAADVVVLPYKSATQSGITQIAYYYELPMIATNVGGLAELVPHERVGLICEPNVPSISSAISRFFTEKLENSFVENIKIEKQKFSWEHFVKSIISQVK